MENMLSSQENALVPINTRFKEFNGLVLRIAIVSVDGEKIPVVALSDIAASLGHDKKGLWKLINEDMLLKCWSVMVLMTMTDGKKYEVLALTLDGFIGLMVKINPKRIKNPERQNKILAFQRWAIPTLRQIMFKEKCNLDSDRLPLTAQEMNVIFEMVKYYEKTKSSNAYQLLQKTLQKVYPDIVLADKESMDQVVEQLRLKFH